MELEEWRDIKGYKGLYQISNLGRVKNIKSGRNLMGGINSDGYYTVLLRKKLKAKSFKIHRLVAAAFISNPENKPQVNHKNGNKIDNKVTNLEWVTCKENVRHAWNNKLSKGKYREVGNRAEKVIQMDLENKIINKYESVLKASEKTGISNTAISNCLVGLSKTSGGFKWKYDK